MASFGHFQIKIISLTSILFDNKPFGRERKCFGSLWIRVLSLQRHLWSKNMCCTKFIMSFLKELLNLLTFSSVILLLRPVMMCEMVVLGKAQGGGWGKCSQLVTSEAITRTKQQVLLFSVNSLLNLYADKGPSAVWRSTWRYHTSRIRENYVWHYSLMKILKTSQFV